MGYFCMILNVMIFLFVYVQCFVYLCDELCFGILYFGFGVFYCVYQVVYIDDVLNVDFGFWGIVVVNLCSLKLVQDLQVQDGLFFVVMCSVDGDSVCVIGVICDWVCVVEDFDVVLVYLVDVCICIVMLIVMEKVYGLDFDIGGLDYVYFLVVVDLQYFECLIGLIGWLVEGLCLCCDVGIVFFMVLCCDNLFLNGWVVWWLVLELVEVCDLVFVEWIVDYVVFLCSMVDRIVFVVIDDICVCVVVLLGMQDVLVIEIEFFI